jgi:2-polyprenyl-6-methoxyphenol hydroxylase-like FAD-dependent oxidoreductase
VDGGAVHIVVVGAGVAGSAAALLLARDGHDVVLVDPDPAPPISGGGADGVFSTWERPAVGQFRQPHNFLGRGRRVLRQRLPDVYARLHAVGATDVDISAFLGDARRDPADEELATLACRRPVFDAVLRGAVAQQSGVETRVGDVLGLVVQGQHVSGVTLSSGETLWADLVVDAAGRGPHSARWHENAGLEPWPEETTECGLLYYSRHYRITDGNAMPPHGSLLGGPRADVGYLAYACFIGDNRTFSLAVMSAKDDGVWRALRDPEAYERVARSLPGVAAWLEVAEPTTSVLPMGALRNTLRHPLDGDRPRTPGLVALGDARFHTNPTFAFGATLSLSHAASLASSIAASSDLEDLALRFEEEIGEDARERYTAVSAEDEERRRIWGSESVDSTDREQAPATFLRSVVYRTAPGDAELLRAVARRIHALDPIDALAQRTDLLDRASARFEDLKADLPPPPPKDQLLAALTG